LSWIVKVILKTHKFLVFNVIKIYSIFKKGEIMASGLVSSPENLRSKIQVYDCSGLGLCKDQIRFPPKIVGNIGGRCVVVQTSEEVHYVRLFGAVFTPRLGDLTKLEFTKQVSRDFGMFKGSNKLANRSIEGISFIQNADELMVQPLNEGQEILEAVTDQVLFFKIEESYTLGLLYTNYEGVPKGFYKKVLAPEAGRLHCHFCCNEALYIVREYEGVFTLEESHIRHKKNRSEQQFDVQHMVYPLKVLPERVMTLKHSFLWISSQNFATQEEGDSSFVTRFRRKSEGQLVAQSFSYDDRIPFDTLRPLASTEKEFFYRKRNDLNEYGLCFYNTEKIQSVFSVSGVIAAEASFEGNVHHIALLEQSSDVSRKIKVFERKNMEPFLSEPTYEIDIEGTPDTLTFLNPAHLGVGLDDPNQKTSFFYQFESGKVNHVRLEQAGGESHLISGTQGLFHWLSSEIKKNSEGIPSYTCFLRTQHVDCLFFGSQSGTLPPDLESFQEVSRQEAFIERVGIDRFLSLQKAVSKGTRQEKRQAIRVIEKLVKGLVE
jgi:CRISPR/Cas system CMR subunit Cmr4 (Cas7 group RAMP superfamily)